LGPEVHLIRMSLREVSRRNQRLSSHRSAASLGGFSGRQDCSRLSQGSRDRGAKRIPVSELKVGSFHRVESRRLQVNDSTFRPHPQPPTVLSYTREGKLGQCYRRYLSGYLSWWKNLGWALPEEGFHYAQIYRPKGSPRGDPFRLRRRTLLGQAAERRVKRRCCRSSHSLRPARIVLRTPPKATAR
jgi:hypothetical protein